MNPTARHEETIGRHPVLEPGESGDGIKAYAAQWDLAFSGAWPLKPMPDSVVDAFARLPTRVGAPLTRTARAVLQEARRLKMARHQRSASVAISANSHLEAAVIVKSVYVMFALCWLVDRYSPDAVVLVRRNPVATATSLVALGTGADRWEKVRRVYEHPINQRDFVRPLGLPSLPDHLDIPESCAWWAAFANAVLGELARQNSGWLQIDHGFLLDNPLGALEALATRASSGDSTLVDRAALEDYLVRSNRPGRGYSTRRVIQRGKASWHDSISAEQRARIQAVVDRFPLDSLHPPLSR